jgi:PrtD family type I secretion system ABC transporter
VDGCARHLCDGRSALAGIAWSRGTAGVDPQRAGTRNHSRACMKPDPQAMQPPLSAGSAVVSVAGLGTAVRNCRAPLVAAAAFSLFINVLLLASPLYMLQVYDRVLRSRSESTLMALTSITVLLLGTMALLELARSRILVRVAHYIDSQLSAQVFSAVCSFQLRQPAASRTQPLTDLSTIRQFVSGGGVVALFDLPWTPIFLLFLFLVHPVLGVIALAGTIAVLVLALAGELLTRHRLERVVADQAEGHAFTDATLRNAESLEAMGMLSALRDRWLLRHRRVLALQRQATDTGATLTTLSRFVRISLQTMMLGSSAVLAIKGVISPGMMIASSIISGKALAPVEVVVANWGALLSARLAWRRLNSLLEASQPPAPTMPLPPIAGRITFEAVVATPPDGAQTTIRGVSFDIAPGEVVGIVGPSGAGKSTIARLIVGVWQPRSGHVRIDGADVALWSREQLGPQLGYLPQDIELSEGSVAENIARFGEVDGVKVVEAARLAGVNDMILRLPGGYDTPLRAGTGGLSSGQRQRLALARALYGEPSICVFDEPNSNLDEEGEAALIGAIGRLKAKGRTIVLIAHRPSVLVHATKVMIISDGTVAAFGPVGDVLPRITRPPPWVAGQTRYET